MATLRNAFTSITDSTHQSVIQGDLRGKYQKAIARAERVNPYSQTPRNAELLQGFGIPTLPFPLQDHPHPACKAIENHLLEVVGHHLIGPTDFLFIKPPKLKQMAYDTSQPHTIHNAHITPKDTLRYPEETVEGLLGKLDHKTAFIHDALHYYTPRTLAAMFHNNPKLQSVLATLVLPCEAVKGHPSLLPDLYTLHYPDAEHFEFRPDGRAAGAYIQKRSTLDWLSVGRIEAPLLGLHITAEKLETLGAHHLYLFSRGLFTHPPFATFDQPELVTLPKIYILDRANCAIPFRRDLVAKLVVYIRTLGDIRERDIWGKIRQLIPTDLMEHADLNGLNLLVDYMLTLHKLDRSPDYEKVLQTSALYRTFKRSIGTITEFFKPLFAGSSYSDQQRLLALPSFKYDLKLKTFQVDIDGDLTTYWSGILGLLGYDDNCEDLRLIRGNNRRKTRSTDLHAFHRAVDKLGQDLRAKTQPHDDRQSAFRDAADALLEVAADESLTFVDLPGYADAVADTPSLEALQARLDDGEASAAFLAEVANEIPPEAVPEALAILTAPPSPADQDLSRLRASLRTFAGSIIDWPCDATNSAIVNPVNHLLVKGAGVDHAVHTAAGPELQEHLLTTCPLINPSDNTGARIRECATIASPSFNMNVRHLIHVLGPRNPPGCEIDLRLAYVAVLIRSKLLGTKHLATPLISAGAFGFSPQQSFGALWDALGSFEAPDLISVTLCHPDPVLLAELLKLRNLTPPVETAAVEVDDSPDAPSVDDDPPPEVERDQTPEPAESSYNQELVALLAKHGCHYSGDKFTPEGQPIDPVWLHPPVAAERLAPQSFSLDESAALAEQLHRLLLDHRRGTYSYEVSCARARAYADDLSKGLVGTLNRRKGGLDLKSLKAICENARDPVALSVVAGAGGSGKSQLLQTAIRSGDPFVEAITIIVPTVNLRGDWEAKLPLCKRGGIRTFETAIEQPAREIVLLDDFGKLPAGYIDLLLCRHPNIKFMILTGDSRQSVYHVGNPDARTAQLACEMDHVAGYTDYYLNMSHRCPANFSKALNIYPTRRDDGSVFLQNGLREHEPILVPGTQHVENYKDMGHVAYTYAGCQGLTVKNCNMVLNNDTALCSERVLYTALTRPTHSITFVEAYGSSTAARLKLSATPFIKTFLSLTRDEDVVPEPKPKEWKDPCERFPRTHIPPENPTSATEAKLDGLMDKQERELFTSKGYTNTVQTEDPFVQAIPRQQAKDEPLLQATIEARLAFATPADNAEHFRATNHVGQIMFENFRIAMGLKGQPLEFDEELWNSCTLEVEKTYLSKPLHMLRNAQNRQDLDNAYNKVFVFLKSQWVKKTEKFALRKAKAGQTIAAFVQPTVIRTGILARYQRRVLDRFQPSHIFINREKTPLQMESFLEENWNHSEPGFANDYTAYDQSQDGCMLNFEVALARWCGCPKDEVNFYINLKMNADTFKGVLTIMRLTGEGPTFDANTNCNIAYHHTRYQVGKVAQLYAGDDMAQNSVPVEKRSWAGIAKCFKLVSKPEINEQPTFTGYRIMPLGIVRDPFKLYLSLNLAEATGNIKNCLESYSRDIWYAYRMGDELYNHFSIEDLVFHHASLRKLLKHGYSPISPDGGHETTPSVQNLPSYMRELLDSKGVKLQHRAASKAQYDRARLEASEEEVIDQPNLLQLTNRALRGPE